VIVSHKYKFIFLKTRKTAGTSVEIALSQFVGERGVITTIDKLDEAVRAGLSFRGPQNEEIPLLRYTLRNWVERLRRGKQALYYNHMQSHSITGRPSTSTHDLPCLRFCAPRAEWDCRTETCT
jgi:hypothetical protein